MFVDCQPKGGKRGGLTLSTLRGEDQGSGLASGREQLANHSTLPISRFAFHQRKRALTSEHALPSTGQRSDLRLAADERDICEPSQLVVEASQALERICLICRLSRNRERLEVRAQPIAGLVAVVRVFGEQLRDHVRK